VAALPWLSPLGRGFSDRGTWHEFVREALEDFTAVLPSGAEDYRRTVHDAALRLYALAAGPSALFFVDKTPAYSLIVDEIALTLPEARLVFLWRHPLAVVSSVVETFAHVLALSAIKRGEHRIFTTPASVGSRICVSDVTPRRWLQEDGPPVGSGRVD
jgi:hypothetical protein